MFNFKTKLASIIKIIGKYGFWVGVAGVGTFLLAFVCYLFSNTVSSFKIDGEFRTLYFFAYGTFRKILAFSSIIFMIIGICSIIIKFLSFYVFKFEKPKNLFLGHILPILLAITCISFTIWGIVDYKHCSLRNDFYASLDYNSGNTSSSTIKTKAQAISLAKNSSKVQNEIAELYDLEFYYTPDWGTTTAKQSYDGSWEVVLKGNISGYKDEYKTNFIYDKKFKVTVKISEYGYIKSVYASKSY